MKPLAIFYHCVISGGERAIDPDYAINMMSHQMSALKESGLMAAASEFIVGVNGSEADAIAAACLCDDKATVVHHGKDSMTEIPTFQMMHEWAKQHPGWYVLYHHTKGVSSRAADGWRNRMEESVIWGWEDCVRWLDAGYDCCGCHWLTPAQFPGSVATPFFGGAFYWAKSDYLTTLPPLPEPTWANRYESEVWIGKSPRVPKIKDVRPGWPNPN